MTIITSKSNNLIKKTKKLLQKKYRKDSYLIEGWHLFEEAQKASVTFQHIFVLDSVADQISDFEQVTLVSLEVLKELTESPTPQGIVAEVTVLREELPISPQGRYLILEDIQDPGNMGTMIRTADAAGLDGVLISEKSADIYNQKTLRSMQGSHFHLPIWRIDALSACQKLQTLGIPVIATTLSQTSVDYREIKQLASFALVMGNEGNGISKGISEQADTLTHIIMPGQAESLNVAVAAGIVLFSLI